MTVITHRIASGRPMFGLPDDKFFGALTQSLAASNPPVIQIKANVK